MATKIHFLTCGLSGLALTAESITLSGILLCLLFCSGYTSAIFLRTCEGSTALLSCSSLEIQITKATYGRQSLLHCNSGTDFLICPENEVTAGLAGMCDGLPSCSITANDGNFPDNCPSVSSYMEINYECVASAGGGGPTPPPYNPCDGHQCFYGSFCHVSVHNTSYCNCTIGVEGLHCLKSAVERVANETLHSTYLTSNKATKYAEDVQLMLQDQIRLNYPDLTKSLFEMVATGKNLMSTLQNSANDGSKLINTAKAITGMMNTVLDFIENNPCSTCTLNASEIISLTDESETSLLDITNLMLGLESTLPLVDIYKDRVNVAVSKMKGDSLSDEYSTNDGSLKLPYWETFQIENSRRRVSVNILSYKVNPYLNVPSEESINTPVLKMGLYDNNGNDFQVADEDDPFTIRIDASRAYSGAVWKDMELLESEEGTYICLSNLTKKLSAVVVEIEIQSTKRCETYGKYGRFAPTKDDYDFHVETKGYNKVLQKKPLHLKIDFYNKILTIVNQTDTGSMDSFLITTRCEDYFYADTTGVANTTRRRKKRYIRMPAHRYRIAAADILYLENGVWKTDGKTQITSGPADSMSFNTNIFGTFSASVFLIPPDTINFDKIFANFVERLANSPYALVANVVLFVIAILVSLLLRRLDIQDNILWQYRELQDNPVDGKYKYFISVYTGVLSSSQLSSVVGIELKGEYGKTRPRVLMDGERKDFIRGTSSNFLLTTNISIGRLQSVLIWHDNGGPSPRWFLDKIVINDATRNERFAFECNKWLSLHCEDGKIWRRLHKDSFEEVDHSVSHLTAHKLFDDHLWLSISKRPNFSRFTRVQRLWTLMALLFLSMVTSAMWYNTGPETSGKSISLGPFEINFKQLYVGVMSSAIAILPSLLIVICFKKRKFKDENKSKSNEKYEEKSEKLEEKQVESGCRLPWWIIFFAYFLVFACIFTSATFTFLYSLEWEGAKTLDWLFAFFFGTTQNVFLLEPLKVIVVSFAIALVCKRKTSSDVPEIAPTTLFSQQDYVSATKESKTSLSMIKAPNTKDETYEMKILRKKSQFDRKLEEQYKDAFIRVMYIVMLCVICSHNTIFLSYYQNEQFKNSLNISAKLNNTQDVWEWLKDSFIPNTFPTTDYNEHARPSYDQRFMYNGYNYRLGPVRMRQVRIKGSCAVPDQISPYVEICPPDYDIINEEKDNFCRGWVEHESSCFDENDDIDYSYLYESDSNTLPYYGIFGVYGNGGYAVNLGPKRSLALTYARELIEYDYWIDNKTRAVIIDAVSFNANTRLFSHVKVVFEFPATGGVFTSSEIWSSNLYPYVESLDYVVLGVQLLFIAVVFIRIIMLIIQAAKLKKRCCSSMKIWVGFLDIFFSMTAIIFYILRIDQTISALERIINNYGNFVSFELVYVFDSIYQVAIAAVLFIAIMDLLRPFTFNYYIYLMWTSIRIAYPTIVTYMIMLAVPVTAFAILLYFLIGNMDLEFKDIQTSLLTMWRMMLCMVNLHRSNGIQTAEAQFVFGLFMVVVAIILFNMFISILNDTFAEVKDQKSDKFEKFDMELNRHFWRKLTSFVVNVGYRFGVDWSYLLEEDLEDEKAVESRMFDIIEKIQIFDDIFSSKYASSEEYETMVSVDACSKLQDVCKSVGKEWVRPPMHYTLGQTPEELRYTYYDFENRKIFQIIGPDTAQSTLDEVNCFDDLLQRKLQNCFEENEYILNERCIEIQTPNSDLENTITSIVIFPINKQSRIVSISFDNGRTWEEYSHDKAKPLQIDMSRLPTNLHIMTTEIQKKQNEWFEIPTSGTTVSVDLQPEVKTSALEEANECSITFPSNCFSKPTNISLKGKIGEEFSEVEIIFFESTQKDVLLKLPLPISWTGQRSDLLLIQRYGQGIWKMLNLPIVVQGDYILFNLGRLQCKTQYSILLKTSTIAKIKHADNIVGLPQESIPMLEKICYNLKIARKWRQLALVLGVYSTIMQLKKDSIPMCAEELCFLTCYEWTKINDCPHIDKFINILNESGILDSDALIDVDNQQSDE